MQAGRQAGASTQHASRAPAGEEDHVWRRRLHIRPLRHSSGATAQGWQALQVAQLHRGAPLPESLLQHVCGSSQGCGSCNSALGGCGRASDAALPAALPHAQEVRAAAHAAAAAAHAALRCRAFHLVAGQRQPGIQQQVLRCVAGGGAQQREGSFHVQLHALQAPSAPARQREHKQSQPRGFGCRERGHPSVGINRAVSLLHACRAG